MGNGSQRYVYTIGYQDTSIVQFIKCLVNNGIKRIIDVRYNALSRKPGFSKTRFSARARKAGMEYLHMREVGINSEARRNLKTEEDYKRLLDDYEKKALRKHKEEIKRISNLAAETPSVLVCFESDPLLCHRTRLAKAVSKQSGIQPKHLRVR